MSSLIILALAVVGFVTINYGSKLKLLFQNGNGKNGATVLGDELRRKNDILMERVTNGIQGLKEDMNRQEESMNRHNDRMYDVLIQIKMNGELALSELKKLNDNIK